jgi:aryl-alcohol dehydrogenase-like predicted oxidoreductase
MRSQALPAATARAQGIDGSRQRLGVDVLDLVQFYWHDYSNKNYVPAALHLADLQAKGKINQVGVTNFDVARLSEIVDAGVTVVSNQVQFSLLDPRPDNGMVEYCAQKGIALLPYGTVAGGFLTGAYAGKQPSE